MIRSHHFIASSILLFAFAQGGCGSASSEPDVIAAPVPSSSRIVLRDAAMVLTMDSNLGQGPLGMLEDADVLFEDGVITAVGQDIDAGDAEVVDASGQIVLPGFVDTHNHLWQSLIRGCGTDMDLHGWLGECVYTDGVMNTTEDEAHALVRLSTYDVIGTGVTTVVDDSHSFTEGFVNGNVRALEESGLRFAYAYCGDAPKFDHMRSVKAALDQNSLASFQVCSHPANFLQEWLTNASGFAQELDVFLNLHLNETKTEQTDDEPFEAMEIAGSLNGKLLVNHAVHLTDAELGVLVANDVRVAHAPLSNMRLAAGIMRTGDMMNAGLEIGLGLDGGTNDTSDMFATMRTAVGVQRALTQDPAVSPTVEEVLLMATIGGARALDMDGEIGSLTLGKRADIIVLNPASINFAPRWNWVSQIVFNGQPRNVEHVFVDGRPLKFKGQVVGEDPQSIIAAAEAAAARIHAAVNSSGQ